MIYYRIDASKTETEEKPAALRHSDRVALAHKVEEYWQKNSSDNEMFFLSEITDSDVKIGAIANSLIIDNANIERFLAFIGFVPEKYSCEEIRFTDILDLLHKAEEDDLIEDDTVILDRAEIRGLCMRYGDGFVLGENMIEELTPARIRENAKKYLVSQSFLPEYKRICSCHRPKLKGHPCHYMITVKRRETRKEISRALMAALYSSGRLQAKRYSYFDVEPDDDFSLVSLDQLFKSSKDSAIVIRFNSGIDYEDNHSTYSTWIIGEIAERILKYKNRVLCILCFHPTDTALQDLVVSKLGGLSLVRISDDKAGRKEAAEYLRAEAEEVGVKPDKKLFEKINVGATYDSEQLLLIFDNWYTELLRRQYPQYSAIPVIETLVDVKKKHTAYDEIQQLVGLSSAKKMLNKVLNYYKGMNLFKSRGLVTDTPTRHIVLTGNPGTCKTTFARLLAGALREAGVLEIGAFVEVGKGDLCAKFVGWTKLYPVKWTVQD